MKRQRLLLPVLVVLAGLGVVVLAGTLQGTLATLSDQVGSEDSLFQAGSWEPDGSPAGLELIAFTAAGNGSDILVEWETATEMENVGFFLYRAEDESTDVWIKLNDSLIPSRVQPGSAAGAVYAWRDEDVKPGRTYYYLLESLDALGVTTSYGPVEVSLGDPVPVETEPVDMPQPSPTLTEPLSMTATVTPTPTFTATPAITPTATLPPVPTATRTPTPTIALPPEPTATPTLTPTATLPPEPTVTPTLTPTATLGSEPTDTPVPSQTPTPSATPVQPTCIQILRNGSFETGAGWALGPVDLPPAYSQDQVHGGDWSIRLRIEPEEENQPLTTWVTQTITLSRTAVLAKLSFWCYPQSDDPDGDYFEVSARDEAGLRHILLEERAQEPGWNSREVDLLTFAGQTLSLRFAVRNDGLSGMTAIYLDDVAIEQCVP